MGIRDYKPFIDTFKTYKLNAFYSPLAIKNLSNGLTVFISILRATKLQGLVIGDSLLVLPALPVGVALLVDEFDKVGPTFFVPLQAEFLRFSKKHKNRH